MASSDELLRILRSGEGDSALMSLYAPDGNQTALDATRNRAINVTEAFVSRFGSKAEKIALFSGPGRT